MIALALTLHDAVARPPAVPLPATDDGSAVVRAPKVRWRAEVEGKTSARTTLLFAHGQLAIPTTAPKLEGAAPRAALTALDPRGRRVFQRGFEGWVHPRAVHGLASGDGAWFFHDDSGVVRRVAVDGALVWEVTAVPHVGVVCDPMSTLAGLRVSARGHEPLERGDLLLELGGVDVEGATSARARAIQYGRPCAGKVWRDLQVVDVSLPGAAADDG